MSSRHPIKLFFLASVLGLAACSGDGNGTGNTDSGNAAVSLYATDDLGNYRRVVITVNDIHLRHTGSGASCDLLAAPKTVDAAELGQDHALEMLDTTQCAARPYNRLHIELDQDVTLTDAAGTTSQCLFTSYLDSGSGNTPNVLQCANGNCTLDINGAVNLLANRREHVAVDFELRDFTVATTNQGCAVTLKVSPLYAERHDSVKPGYLVGVKGFVSNLNTTADTFTLTRDGRSVTVSYAGITTQEGLDTLLGTAQSDRLLTKVRCASFNADSAACTPSAVVVEATGTIAALDTTAQTFALQYTVNQGGGTLPRSLAVAYGGATVEGALTNSVRVETALAGYNATAQRYLARKVEVE